MKSARGHLEEEDDDEEFGIMRKDNTGCNNITKDGKNIDKANTIRSKHSVTEQRRRSKINERFQILRDLIPHSDQKRDTASFLLEVIEYVQHLQERVQKYEGSYQEWGSEPSKLTPWRNSHWRVQSFVGNPQSIKNGPGSGSSFPMRLDENSIPVTPVMHTNSQNPIGCDPTRDVSCKVVDQPPELLNKGVSMPVPLQAGIPIRAQGDGLLSHTLQRPVSEAQSTECLITDDSTSQHEELTIEGGTISVSSVYSQGLLNTLTQALQSAGMDLSQATISVQIDLGKQAMRGVTSGMSISKDHDNPPDNQPLGRFLDASNGVDSSHAQKRPRI